MSFKKLAATAACIALSLGGGVLAAAPAGAAATSHINTPEHGGLSLDVWQQRAAVNTQIRVYKTSATDVAEQFVEVPLTYAGAPAGSFEIQYAPGGVLSGLDVSTVTDVSGAYAELRGATAPGVANSSQDFITVAQGDGFSQIKAFGEPAPGPLYLNVKGWGGSGGQVISYASTGAAENQIWETTTP